MGTDNREFGKRETNLSFSAGLDMSDAVEGAQEISPFAYAGSVVLGMVAVNLSLPAPWSSDGYLPFFLSR
ncbi:MULTISPECIES: hypothetical protein [unclassified Bradyrhizobium]|uniref:hypothetical protein n=1 Tax=unclassified Bradyrhizobium TaxID=2631580 RepID=UPI0028E86D78|nr:MULTISPECIES: hypothetical protein [unclassified Bradyrhizobium]